MQEVRIIAVSLEGGDRVQHITHIWTVGGALSRQLAVEDMWARRCRYYTMAPTGRIEVSPVPARRPGLLDALLRRRVPGHLESTRGATLKDSLLSLPRLPSPTRPRRSQAAAMTMT